MTLIIPNTPTREFPSPSDQRPHLDNKLYYVDTTEINNATVSQTSTPVSLRGTLNMDARIYINGTNVSVQVQVSDKSDGNFVTLDSNANKTSSGCYGIQNPGFPFVRFLTTITGTGTAEATLHRSYLHYPELAD